MIRAPVHHRAMPTLEPRAALHVVLHVAVPLAIAIAWRRDRWPSTWLVLLAGWLIDVDHLLADPVYAPGRCSIGFHPLHGPLAIAACVALLVPRRSRVFAVGLLIHIALDALDCLLMR